MKTTLKKWWQSSNFWNQIVTLAAAIFVALGGVEFPTEDAQQIVSGAFAIFAGGNILYHYFKDMEIRGGIKDVLRSSNFWTNAATIVISFAPWFPIDALQELITAILDSNLQAILVAGFNAVNIILKLVKSRGEEKPALATT